MRTCGWLPRVSGAARGDPWLQSCGQDLGERTWPACYVEWWFGDGAPGLDRDRPMLFEEVARRLINIEEHEYSLPSDEEKYVAARQSRFNAPEIV